MRYGSDGYILGFIMTEMLGYKDVKVYDGSYMEWLLDPNAPTEP